ncbi:MAG: hypothetical protein C4297_14660 [Gemmataceae bacterium]
MPFLVLLPVVPEPQEAIKPSLPVNNKALARIKGLQANEGRVIGQVQVVGDFNAVARQFNLDKTGPRGRDYCQKMVWAPERRRALYCGANHGVPHRLNDVWEFDLAAFAWIMLYAPDNPRSYLDLGKDFSDVEFKDGILITKRGGPAVIAHTWWGLTYDPQQKMLLFMNTWVTDQKKAVVQLGGDPAQIYAGPPLWGFIPQTGRWKVIKTKPPYPRPIFGGLLEYIPDLKGSVWHANNWQMHGTWLYDARSNSWKDLKANGSLAEFEKQSPPPEQVGCYDSKRKLLLVQRHKDTFHYNPQTNAWKKVLTEGEAPDGHDAWAPMYYDPHSGHALLVDFKTNTLWAYDPDQPGWTKLNPVGDPMPQGHKRLAYFDPAHNVFVIIQGTTVWAYRYKP